MSTDEDTPRSKNAEKLRRWRAANRERYLAQRRAYYRRHREQMLAAAKAYRETNPEKVRAAQARWFDKNRERESARAVEWARQNPERKRAIDRRRYVARVTGTRPALRAETEAMIATLLTLPCSYCGTTGKVEIDHIIPLSRGGLHEPGNLAAACKSCNSSKGAKLLSEWRPDDVHLFNLGPEYTPS